MTDQEILAIYTKSNGAPDSNKLREKWLNKHLEIKEYLEHRYDPELFMGFNYVLKCIFKGFTELPKCKMCKEILKDPDRIYCSYKCAYASPERTLNMEITKLEKYGNKKYNNIDKCRETKLKNWGNSNYCNPEKTKETKLKNWGDPNYCNSEKIKETVEKHKLEDELYYEKKNLKAQQTKEEKYGDPNYNNREKAKQTCLEKYDDPYFNNPEKNRQTCLEHWGVEYFPQSKQYHKKRFRKYYYDNIYFDSSWELAFYIYYKDQGFKIEREPIRFEYTFNNKIHYYSPDFRMNNKLYEIKGKHLIDKETGKWIDFYKNIKSDEEVEAKHQCAIANNVEIISDCKEYFKYVNEKYGKNFIKSCKCKNKHELKNEEDND